VEQERGPAEKMKNRSRLLANLSHLARDLGGQKNLTGRGAEEGRLKDKGPTVESVQTDILIAEIQENLL